MTSELPSIQDWAETKTEREHRALNEGAEITADFRVTQWNVAPFYSVTWELHTYWANSLEEVLQILADNGDYMTEEVTTD